MSDNDVVLDASRPLEKLLKERFDATGRGLHELATDVQDRLSEADLKAIRYVATLRNKVIHEGLVLTADDRGGISDASRRVQDSLRTIHAATASRRGSSAADAIDREPHAGNASRPLADQLSDGTLTASESGLRSLASSAGTTAKWVIVLSLGIAGILLAAGLFGQVAALVATVFGAIGSAFGFVSRYASSQPPLAAAATLIGIAIVVFGGVSYCVFGNDGGVTTSACGLAVVLGTALLLWLWNLHPIVLVLALVVCLGPYLDRRS